MQQGFLLTRIMQKQETHGTQSMSFEDTQQFLLSTQTKKPPA